MRDCVFIDFDLPEVVSVAAYFLAKSYPEKRVLLYGENDYGPDTHGRYDLIFMPSYEIAKVGTSTVDLFANASSLGEMTRDAARNYVERIVDGTDYFLHINHDRLANVFEGGERALLAHEYPVPGDKFDLLFRYPELFQLTSGGFVDLRSDSFIYLYGYGQTHRRTTRRQKNDVE